MKLDKVKRVDEVELKRIAMQPFTRIFKRQPVVVNGKVLIPARVVRKGFRAFEIAIEERPS